MRLADKAFSAMRSNPLFADGQISQAREFLSQAETAGRSCRDWIQIGAAYLELGDTDKACEALGKARETDPYNPAAVMFSVLGFIDKEDFDEAQKMLDKLHELSPDNQAAPTERALLLMRQDKISEVLNIIFPERGTFDLTVSAPVQTRFALAVEAWLLKHELPDIPDDNETGLAIGSGKNSEAEDRAPAAESEKTAAEGSLTSEKEAVPEAGTANKEAAPAEDGKSSQADSTAAAGTDSGKSPLGSAAGLLSVFDAEASALASRGTRRLEKCWEMKPEKRLEEMGKACEDLRKAYDKNPAIPQLAYALGEASLGLVEYAHVPGKNLNSEDLEKVRQAEKCFMKALEENPENAYTLHYEARCAFLQRQYRKAEQAWEMALKYFEKLPEADYGLAQTCIMLGREAKARQYLNRSLSSDLQIMRERLEELKKTFENISKPAETGESKKPQTDSNAGA